MALAATAPCAEASRVKRLKGPTKKSNACSQPPGKVVKSYVALLNLVESEKDGPSREVRGCCLDDTSWNNAQASPARPLRAIRALIRHLARADAQHAGVK
jgi:hypothetical protein